MADHVYFADSLGVCACTCVCADCVIVWLLFWMRLHEFLIPSAICADAVTKAHGKCSLGGYPLLPMCLEAPVSQHVIVNHNHRGRGRDTCIALFISTSHPLFFLLLLLFIMLFSLGGGGVEEAGSCCSWNWIKMPTIIFLPFILIVYTLIIFLFILFDCIGPG